MSSHDWNEFPFADSAFEYSGAGLMRGWSRLHQGDCEPFSDAARIKTLLKASPQLVGGLPQELSNNPKALAEALQSAWRHYHAGQFQKAYEEGDADAMNKAQEMIAKATLAEQQSSNMAQSVQAQVIRNMPVQAPVQKTQELDPETTHLNNLPLSVDKAPEIIKFGEVAP